MDTSINPGDERMVRNDLERLACTSLEARNIDLSDGRRTQVITTDDLIRLVQAVARDAVEEDRREHRFVALRNGEVYEGSGVEVIDLDFLNEGAVTRHSDFDQDDIDRMVKKLRASGLSSAAEEVLEWWAERPGTHTFVVTVSGCGKTQAERVMIERTSHDEEYGFDYTIGWHYA